MCRRAVAMWWCVSVCYAYVAIPSSIETHLVCLKRLGACCCLYATLLFRDCLRIHVKRLCMCVCVFESVDVGGKSDTFPQWKIIAGSRGSSSVTHRLCFFNELQHLGILAGLPRIGLVSIHSLGRSA